MTWSRPSLNPCPFLANFESSVGLYFCKQSLATITQALPAFSDTTMCPSCRGTQRSFWDLELALHLEVLCPGPDPDPGGRQTGLIVSYPSHIFGQGSISQSFTHFLQKKL